MNNQARIEICLSPALLHLYDTQDTVVVIIDVFRATSTIAAALYNGAYGVVPVAEVDECIRIGASTVNSLTAGERDGKIAPGLLHGNSPLEYHREAILDKKLILTTTNGTKLLHMVKESAAIITGAFVNISATCSFLKKENKNVLLTCAAWRDKVNLEDTLFAGGVLQRLQQDFVVGCDSSLMALKLYESAQGELLESLKHSNHYKRLSGFGLHEDLKLCTTEDAYPVLPYYNKTEKILKKHPY